MARNKALKITALVIGLILLFSIGVYAGLEISSRFSIYIPNIEKLISKESDKSASLDAQVSANENLSFKSIEQTIDIVSRGAISSKTKSELIVAAINGILASLEDKYAEYFTKEEYGQIMESYQGMMSGGIGVIVTMNAYEEVEVVKVISNSPSSGLDIKQGDIIKKVNGEDVSGLTLEEVVSKIKGEIDTQVVIVFFRPSEHKELEHKIIRGTFTVPNFTSELLEGDIAYIQYYDFQENGAQELEVEINALKEQGAKGIILDLRNNLGGVLDDAVYLCDLFLDEGLIVRVKGKTDGKDSVVDYKAEKGKFTDMPMIVMINGYSASASELCAGALKDNGRAVLLGEKSYGKGTVQNLQILVDGSGIKFTTAKYYLPSGITIDGTGIKPDIEVILTPEDTEDVQKNRAVEELKRLIK